MDLVFEQPPARTRGKHLWWDRVTPLMDHPDQWVNLTATYNLTAAVNVAQALASKLRNRHVLIPPGQWEFTARGSQLYSRYLGPEQ